jgi:hypothetical protein
VLDGHGKSDQGDHAGDHAERAARAGVDCLFRTFRPSFRLKAVC